MTPEDFQALEARVTALEAAQRPLDVEAWLAGIELPDGIRLLPHETFRRGCPEEGWAFDEKLTIRVPLRRNSTDAEAWHQAWELATQRIEESWSALPIQQRDRYEGIDVW